MSGVGWCRVSAGSTGQPCTPYFPFLCGVWAIGAWCVGSILLCTIEEQSSMPMEAVEQPYTPYTPYTRGGAA